MHHACMFLSSAVGQSVAGKCNFIFLKVDPCDISFFQNIYVPLSIKCTTHKFWSFTIFACYSAPNHLSD